MFVFLFDWFVGIKGVNFCNVGKWVDSLNIILLLFWDVGIDDGDMFNFIDVDFNLVINIVCIIKDMVNIFFMGLNVIVILGMLMFKRVNKFIVFICSGE